jgi:3-oxoacyl-[acyl-carrier protein] reductase
VTADILSMSTPPPYPPARQLLLGQKVLVTAAAGTGIGFAAAKRAIEEGAVVFVSDIHERRLNEAVERLRSIDSQRVFGYPCDVTKQSEVNALVESAIATLGHVDVLINNAGLGGTANLIDMKDDEWSRVLDVSLTSVMRMTRAILPHMQARQRGAIVNNASVLGWRAQAGQSHYAAAKAGVMALTRCAAIEAAPYGVRINAVAPSIAMHAFLQKTTTPELLAELSRREAFGRPAEVWEVANVMIFLACDLSSYMTGEILSVSSQHP